MDQIFDSEKIMQEYGGEFLSYFEDLIKQNMQNLFEGIIQQDWVKILWASDSVKEGGKQSYAHRLVGVTFLLFRFLLQHQKPNEFTISFKESLDEEAKLQAMDQCKPIFEEARLLRLEMSKYTNSGVPQDIYLNEIEQIRELHENMKKQYQMKQSESQTNNFVITNLDKPENASCTEKCTIF